MKVAEASLIKTFVCCVFEINYFRLQLSPPYPNEMWAARLLQRASQTLPTSEAVLQADEMSDTVREIV